MDTRTAEATAQGAATLRPVWGVQVVYAPGAGTRGGHAVAARCARALEIPLSDTRKLLETTPVMLPRAFLEPEAHRLAAVLEKAGARAQVRRHPAAGGAACQAHPTLINDGSCGRCGVWVCAACKAQAGGEALCPRCRGRARRGRFFRRLRMAVLLAGLVAAGVWALQTTHRRASRTDWSRTLRVAVVVLRHGPVPETAIDALVARIPALASVLDAEFRRHTGRETATPFLLLPVGVVDVPAPPPAGLPDPVFLERAEHALSLWLYLDDVHDTLGMDPDDYDARLYVVARSGVRTGGSRFVEGEAEAGGEVGIVHAVLADDTIDGTLIATAHELFHLLGATDKYDADGHPLIPDGLPEPDRTPLFPQRFVEVMAGAIALGPGDSRPAWRLDQLRVGPVTAAEIGWTPRP